VENESKLKIIINYFKIIDHHIIFKSNSFNFKNYLVFNNVKGKKIFKILFYLKISNWLRSQENTNKINNNEGNF